MDICYIKLVSKARKAKSDIDTIVIDDTITYTDQYCVDRGFINLTKTIKTPCAWDKSFLYIKEQNLLDKYDYFWFIEDDVYIPNSNLFDSFNVDSTDLLTNILPLIEVDKRNNWRRWSLIKSDISYFDINLTMRTFNPLCRLSNRLIKSILDFQQQHNTFAFHEILFPTIAQQNNFSIFLFKNLPNYRQYFACFRHRPVISKNKILKHLINHPVKDLYEGQISNSASTELQKTS